MGDLRIYCDNIEDTAKQQILDLMKEDSFSDSKVRIMPDAHAGKGCVIGFTSSFEDKVIPNLVGVDIGCGMYVCNLGQANIDFSVFDKNLREKLPSGFNVRNNIDYPFKRIYDLKCFDSLHNVERIEKSMGTLGGGNHFVEIGKGENGDYYLVIHTGSRNLGKQVAEHYQKLAIAHCDNKKEKAEIIRKCKANGQEGEIETLLKQFKTSPLPHLCYIEGKEMQDYLHDMKICQEYASYNRECIADTLLCGYQIAFSHFETIHNYIDLEQNIVRKGAISAKENELALIPINMRDGSLLVKGKGNADWNYSAPHGAGRIMGRMQAKKSVDFEEFKKTMEGIYSTSVTLDTIDESPMVYKNMESIIEQIGDTVEILDIIKPLYNFKACEA